MPFLTSFIIKNWRAILIGLAVLTLVSFGFYIKHVIDQNAVLKEKVERKDKRIDELENTVKVIQEDIAQQNLKLSEFNGKISAIEVDSKKEVQIFVKHDLQSLSAAKPGLIEKRVNKATQAVFADLQHDTETFHEEVTK